MSAPAKDGPGVPQEKKGGLSKMVSRMKTVLKRSDGSKRLSFSSKSTPLTTTAGPSVTKSSEPTPVIASASAPAPTLAPEPVVKTTTPEGPQQTKFMRSQIDAARAKKLSDHFAMTVNPMYSGPDREISRMEKPIRMRIHRSCHRCNATFRGSRVCAECEHVRCKACPRYPLKKPEKKEKSPAVAPVIAIEPDTYWGLREQILLTRPSARPGGQPLVRKEPKQRVRRTCHECKSLFIRGNKTCTGCGHVRCTECPRDPHKKKKYPDGYPGDAFSSNTTIPVKFSCHKCLKVFPAVPHPDSEEGKARREGNVEPLACVRCNHPMCSDCPRAKPVRVEPAPDPDVLRAVQARLAALNISTPIAAAS
ncbi:hypothetical protein WAI453_008801 [Rhynchosporium graminicola]|uniref:Uncharacterized protein n=1 Tax=Rhynchosporium graminicola TaxID=2792576 RepID=A0A1E1KI66_9HELO|nr:uncharacterized protein RCO7_00080 [Rhynchosporium commune]